MEGENRMSGFIAILGIQDEIRIRQRSCRIDAVSGATPTEGRLFVSILVPLQKSMEYFILK